MKIALNEIKKNPQETNSGGDETEIQINDLEHKEEKTVRTERRNKNSKNKNRIRRFWDISKSTNIWIRGLPEGEEEEQEIENLLEKNNESKLPQFGKRNRHTSLGNTESPKQDKHKENQTKTHHN